MNVTYLTHSGPIIASKKMFINMLNTFLDLTPTLEILRLQKKGYKKANVKRLNRALQKRQSDIPASVYRGADKGGGLFSHYFSSHHFRKSQ